MELNKVKPDLQVRTNKTLGNTQGMIVKPEYLANRRPDILGTVKSYVAGHGGDVWFVEHEDGQIAPYCFDEFESV